LCQHLINAINEVCRRIAEIRSNGHGVHKGFPRRAALTAPSRAGLQLACAVTAVGPVTVAFALALRAGYALARNTAVPGRAVDRLVALRADETHAVDAALARGAVAVLVARLLALGRLTRPVAAVAAIAVGVRLAGTAAHAGVVNATLPSAAVGVVQLSVGRVTVGRIASTRAFARRSYALIATTDGRVI
jgi:hypothetical protein